MPIAAMFTVINPKSWPTPPVSWNFSLLKEIETCPRQWALSAAAYPELWGGLGDPPANNPRALAGQAIHAAVSNVCAALSDAGCTEAFDVRAVGVLRKMGGFTPLTPRPDILAWRLAPTTRAIPTR